MSAKIRNLPRDFNPDYSIKFPNVLVSGCSFTYNNSEEHVCTWPYYLRNHTGAEYIYDCSQSGAGTNHIFNSVINDLEHNRSLTPDNTLIIVMWSGLSRTDVIATKNITKDWHHMSNYEFDLKFSSLSIFNSVNGNTPLHNLCKAYKSLIDPDAQIYESLLKIIALKSYLDDAGFQYVFTSFQDPLPELKQVQTPMTKTVWKLLNNIDYLKDFSELHDAIDNTGHPMPEIHATWTRDCLIPHLVDLGYCTDLK